MFSYFKVKFFLSALFLPFFIIELGGLAIASVILTLIWWFTPCGQNPFQRADIMKEKKRKCKEEMEKMKKEIHNDK